MFEKIKQRTRHAARRSETTAAQNALAMKRVNFANVDVDDSTRQHEDAQRHSELLAKIAEIGEKDRQSKRIRTERTEPSLQESLFTFSDKAASGTKQKKLTAKDLIDALQPKSAGK